MSSPCDQSRYQVRLEHGRAGLERLAPADVVVVVDVLRFSTTVTRAVSAGEDVALDDAAHAVSLNGAALAAAAGNAAGATTAPIVLLGCLRNASAVAATIAAEQQRRGARTSVAVIAAGELTSRDENALLRAAVEDDLGAGAVIDALAAHGIDHTSPDAAVAGASFAGLRRALTHLLTASGSGQELIAHGRRDEVVDAAALDADACVPMLRDGVFVAFAPATAESSRPAASRA